MTTRDPVPPDGGWGWVVVALTFLAHAITHGVIYSFGVVFGSIQERYGTDNAATSWIAALATGFLFLAGPLASAVTTKYGCRTASVAGAVLSASGIVVTAVVSNVYVLYLGYGIMAGVGYGMVFLSSIVSVNQHFEKRRSIACTLSMSGCAVGAFIFNPLVKFCLDTYGLQGTLLLEGAILLNCVVSGVALTPVTTRNEALLHEGVEKECQYSIDDLVSHEIECSTGYSRSHSRIQHSQDCVALKPADNDVISTHSATCRAYKPADVSMHNVQIKYSSLDDIGNTYSVKTSGRSSLLKQSMLRASLWNSDYMMFSSQSMAEISKLSIHETTHSDSQHEVGRDDDDDSNSKTGHDCSGVWKYLLLFKEMAFVVFLLVQVSLHLGVYLPFIYLPDLAISAGISEYTAAWTVSMIGVSSILGRVFFGCIGDLACVDRNRLFCAALMISGLSTAFLPWYNGVASLMTYAVVYGVFVGVAICFSPVLLTDLVGLARLPRAFGIVNMFNGIACLVGPPLAGLAYDQVCNYDVSFPVAGVAMVIGSLLMYATSCINPYNSGSENVVYWQTYNDST